MKIPPRTLKVNYDSAYRNDRRNTEMYPKAKGLVRNHVPSYHFTAFQVENIQEWQKHSINSTRSP